MFNNLFRRAFRRKKSNLLFLCALFVFCSLVYIYLNTPITRLNWTFLGEADTESSNSDSSQSCKIPKLDPFHPDVKPFLNYFEKPECEYPQWTHVTDEGYLQIKDNVKASKAKFAYVRRIGDFKTTLSDWKEFGTNENKEVKLTEDIVKVITEVNGKKHEEFHVYPTRIDDPLEEKPKPREPNKLNIVFFMVDSMSHSCGERYLKKTVKRLKSSASTVILNGHTIVGDGTTAQLSAMFIGKLEKDLPEGRRGFDNAKSIDRWPFIFKEFEEQGYETLYSEDSQKYNSFNYRLLGFDNPPTQKYLRPFWLAGQKYTEDLDSKSPKCSPKIALQYLRRFLVNYKDRPSLTFTATSSLAHDYTPTVQVSDQELVDFMQFLDDTNMSNHTVFILFGDHGDRMGKFRSTMVGKLEERLPFMSFTFPPWFPQKFPEEFRQFRHNANLLTSHFDVYSTLKHLQTFPKNKHHHRIGKSLLTNISYLDRSCADAGILDHWCTCVNYRAIATNDTLIVKAANAIVNQINKKAAGLAEEQCELLELESVERAGLVTPSSHVQNFYKTFKDKACDECGIKKYRSDFYTDTVEIVFVVSPSGGKYEGTAVYNYNTKQFTSSGEISRINAYKDQPACIATVYPHLRPFCYCKNQNSV